MVGRYTPFGGSPGLFPHAVSMVYFSAARNRAKKEDDQDGREDETRGVGVDFGGFVEWCHGGGHWPSLNKFHYIFTARGYYEAFRKKQ